MPEQEQNTVQTQESDDFNAYVEAQESSEDTSGAGEKPAAESAEKAETSETKEEPKGDDPDGEDPEGDKDGEEPAAEKPKRKGGFQKKIDALTRKNHELAERLAALEKGGHEKTEKPAAKADNADDSKPRQEDFDDFDDFVEKLTDWKLLQHEKAKSAQAAEAEAAKGWKERVKEARKQFADYDEVLEAAEDIQVPEVLRTALIEAGPAVVYHLAKHPEEAERIANLNPVTAARELGKIEASLATAEKKAPPPQPKKPSSAPKPLSPLAGSGNVPRSIHDYDGEDFEEYESLRR